MCLLIFINHMFLIFFSITIAIFQMEGKFIRFKLQEIFNTVTKRSCQILNTSQKIFFYRTQYKLISVYHKCEFALVLISKMMNLLLICLCIHLFLFQFTYLSMSIRAAVSQKIVNVHKYHCKTGTTLTVVLLPTLTIPIHQCSLNAMMSVDVINYYARIELFKMESSFHLPSSSVMIKLRALV